jgi:nucleoside recognition membrane protein YjiH
MNGERSWKGRALLLYCQFFLLWPTLSIWTHARMVKFAGGLMYSRSIWAMGHKVCTASQLVKLIFGSLLYCYCLLFLTSDRFRLASGIIKSNEFQLLFTGGWEEIARSRLQPMIGSKCSWRCLLDNLAIDGNFC